MADMVVEATEPDPSATSMPNDETVSPENIPAMPDARRFTPNRSLEDCKHAARTQKLKRVKCPS